MNRDCFNNAPLRSRHVTKDAGDDRTHLSCVVEVGIEPTNPQRGCRCECSLIPAELLIDLRLSWYKRAFTLKPSLSMSPSYRRRQSRSCSSSPSLSFSLSLSLCWCCAFSSSPCLLIIFYCASVMVFHVLGRSLISLWHVGDPAPRSPSSSVSLPISHPHLPPLLVLPSSVSASPPLSPSLLPPSSSRI